MIAVDTNVLVHAASTEAGRHAPALEFLERLRREEPAWFLTWPVVYEFVRVVTHRAVLPRPLSDADALRFVDACLAAPGCRILRPTERHRAVLAEVVADASPLAGNIWHDVHTVVLMLENGVSTIASYDRDFRRFRRIRALEPGVPGASA